jgi:hypothetical protein
MGRASILAITLVLAGCGGGNDSGDDNEQPPAEMGPCAAPVGQYEQAYTLKSGTCPELSDTVVDLTDGGPAVGTFNSACMGSGSVSPDGCKYQVDATCPATPVSLENAEITLYGAAPPTLRLIGTTNWNNAGTHGTGVWSYKRSSPLAALACVATFDVELTQL